MFLLRKILYVALLVSICTIVNAEIFVIQKIRVYGLKRISLGTVLSYLPVKEGDEIDSSQTSDIIRELYKTRFFSDVTLRRKNDDLIISVTEQAVIGSLSIVGNSKISKKELVGALKSVGISEGYELDPATLKAIEQAIIQQYYSLGLYSAKVNINVKPEKRNRVSVAINIKEGPVAKIRSIRIVGNKSFSEKKLIKELSLATTKPWSFLTGSNRYSKEKLDADLEKLRSFYMDRGYLNVRIDSTKVGITPDKKAIYITVKVDEGPVYRLSGFALKGSFIGKKREMLELVVLKAGDVFSRKDVIGAQRDISLFLSENGYGMPTIKVEPKIDERNKKVWVNFIIEPGQRVYVHNIIFKGNYKTGDNVLRREMRLQEGGLYSISKINESRRRLANLGYLQNIDYKVEPVSGANNQIDLIFNVKEVSAITANLQAGYSDRDGFIYGASLNDQNIFGTGKTAAIRFDNTKATQYYSINYRDPYFTPNKVGLSASGYFQKINYSKIHGDLSSIPITVYGTRAAFDAPLSDHTQVSLAFDLKHIEVKPGPEPGVKVDRFIEKYGSIFNQFVVSAGLSFSNLDRAIFPTKGFAHSILLKGSGPLDHKSLSFYKAHYNATLYRPLFRDDFILRLHTELGYGDGIGKSKDLPIFSHFYAGGMDSVRGFEANTLSDFEDKDKVVGGNILTLASASLILPAPSPLKDTVRPSIFFDIGNVYDNYFKFGDLRSSVGVQIEWRTPIAPLIFSFAKPIHKKDWDETTTFQFSISASI